MSGPTVSTNALAREQLCTYLLQSNHSGPHSGLTGQPANTVLEGLTLKHGLKTGLESASLQGRCSIKSAPVGKQTLPARSASHHSPLQVRAWHNQATCQRIPPRWVLSISKG